MDGKRVENVKSCSFSTQISWTNSGEHAKSNMDTGHFVQELDKNCSNPFKRKLNSPSHSSKRKQVSEEGATERVHFESELTTSIPGYFKPFSELGNTENESCLDEQNSPPSWAYKVTGEEITSNFFLDHSLTDDEPLNLHDKVCDALETRNFNIAKGMYEQNDTSSAFPEKEEHDYAYLLAQTDEKNIHPLTIHNNLTFQLTTDTTPREISLNESVSNAQTTNSESWLSVVDATPEQSFSWKCDELKTDNELQQSCQLKKKNGHQSAIEVTVNNQFCILPPEERQLCSQIKVETENVTEKGRLSTNISATVLPLSDLGSLNCQFEPSIMNKKDESVNVESSFLYMAPLPTEVAHTASPEKGLQQIREKVLESSMTMLSSITKKSGTNALPEVGTVLEKQAKCDWIKQEDEHIGLNTQNIDKNTTSFSAPSYNIQYVHNVSKKLFHGAEGSLDTPDEIHHTLELEASLPDHQQDCQGNNNGIKLESEPMEIETCLPGAIPCSSLLQCTASQRQGHTLPNEVKEESSTEVSLSSAKPQSCLSHQNKCDLIKQEVEDTAVTIETVPEDQSSLLSSDFKDQIKDYECKKETLEESLLGRNDTFSFPVVLRNQKEHLKSKAEIKSESDWVTAGLELPDTFPISSMSEHSQESSEANCQSKINKNIMKKELLEGKSAFPATSQIQAQSQTQELKKEPDIDESVSFGIVPAQTVLVSLVHELQKLQQTHLKKSNQKSPDMEHIGLRRPTVAEDQLSSLSPCHTDQCKNNEYKMGKAESELMPKTTISVFSSKNQNEQMNKTYIKNRSKDILVDLGIPNPVPTSSVFEMSPTVDGQNYQVNVDKTVHKEEQGNIDLMFPDANLCSVMPDSAVSQYQTLFQKMKEKSVLAEPLNAEVLPPVMTLESFTQKTDVPQCINNTKCDLIKQEREEMGLNTQFGVKDQSSLLSTCHNDHCEDGEYKTEQMHEPKLEIYNENNERELLNSQTKAEIKKECQWAAVSTKTSDPAIVSSASEFFPKCSEQNCQLNTAMIKKENVQSTTDYSSNYPETFSATFNDMMFEENSTQQQSQKTSCAIKAEKEQIANDPAVTSALFVDQNDLNRSQSKEKMDKEKYLPLDSLFSETKSTSKPPLSLCNDIEVMDSSFLHGFQDSVTQSFKLTIPHTEKTDRPIFRNMEFQCHFNFESLTLLNSFSQLYRAIHLKFQEVFDLVGRELNDDDYVQLELCTEGHKDSVILQTRVNEMSADIFLNKAVGDLQRKKEILPGDYLTLTLQTVTNLRGGGGTRLKLQSILTSNIINRKIKHLFIVKNKDNNLCFAATLMGLMDLKNAHINKIMREAAELHKRLNLPPQHMVSFSDIAKFEELLDIKIRVYYRGPHLQEFETSPCLHPRTYFMYLQDNHYYGIINLKIFLGAREFCNLCHRPGCRGHKCSSTCKVCLSTACWEVKNERVVCKDCYRTCRSRLCYTTHKLPKTDEKYHKPIPSQCDSVRHCQECRSPVHQAPGVKAHKCQTLKCQGCGERSRDEKHRCFLSELKPEPPTDKYVFFDIICRPGHIPCYIYAVSMDGTVEKEFYDEDCIAQFCTFFIQSCFEGYTFFAHNCKYFDGDLILKFLFQNHLFTESLYLGSKVKGFEVMIPKIRFINTYCFIPMKLRAMPKAFGFGMFRGYFPHYLNTPQYEKYCGDVPPVHYYGERHVTEGKNMQFMKWYELKKRNEFNMQNEIRMYSKNSVKILLQACLCFRNIFSDGKDIDPFKYKNIGSAAIALFQTYFLPKNKIPVIPFDNYRRENRYFQTPSIQWLEYVSAVEGIKIQHALNAGEKQFGPYFVDGFATTSTGDTCFLYCACSTYGCSECLKNTGKRSCVLFSKKHKDLQKKLSYLKERNLQIRVMWEHEWLELKQDSKMRPFLKKYPDPFDPCESIYGNRAEVTCLLYKAQPEEKIHYYTFNDLLTYVHKTKLFPVGHPVIIRENFEDLSEYFGFAKVTVYPPRKLLFPVLGAHFSGRLLFTLCRTCTEMKLTAICTHEEEQRSLTGIWSTVELSKALECGYRVGKIFEVWHFEKCSTKLFLNYIKSHIKRKKEAQGFPSWCNSDEQKAQYVKKYLEEEGLQLDMEHIKRNPGIYKVCSLLLSSFWEELGNKYNYFRNSTVTKQEEFDKLVFSKLFNVLYFNFCSEEMAFIQWQYDSDTRKSPEHVFLASFASAYAHLELYSILERLQDRCLYFDTDSVVFVSCPGDWDPPLSNKLGGFSSRLKKNDHIIEFASANHNTYGFKTFKGEAYMKVKGFSFKHATADEVNIASITKLVQKNAQKDVPDKIITNVTGANSLKKQIQPTFNIVFDQRVLNSDHFTCPYGF